MKDEAKRQERRVFALMVLLALLLFAAVYCWRFGAAYVAYWKYSPQEGDVLFQSLPHSRLVNAIEGVTHSPYSHCGIVAKRNGKWVVYEAYDGVEVTPLREFVFRGRRQGFAAYRFKSSHRKFIATTISHAAEYVGRPYDVRYRMDDEFIYCSELIYKAYRTSSGGQHLGRMLRLDQLDWRPFVRAIRHFERGPVPLDREMITPVQMARAEQLELVFVHRIAVPE